MRPTTRLRKMLNEPGIIVAPGAYDCLTAKIIEREGFPAVYMTGAGTSVSRLGMPDLGLASVSEMVANAGAIAATVDDQPAVAFTTVPARTAPRLVSTPVTLPFRRAMPVTSVKGWSSAPSLSAPRP